MFLIWDRLYFGRRNYDVPKFCVKIDLKYPLLVQIFLGKQNALMLLKKERQY